MANKTKTKQRRKSLIYRWQTRMKTVYCTQSFKLGWLITMTKAYNGGGHTCRNKEPKTIESAIERAATQSFV